MLDVVAVEGTQYHGGPRRTRAKRSPPPAPRIANYRRLEVRIGAESRIATTLVGASVIAVGAFGTGAVGGAFGWPMLAATGPAFSVAAGLSIFAVDQRSLGSALAAGVIAALAGAALVVGADARVASTAMLVVCGLVGIAVGINCRRSSRWLQ